jgi:UrcA family protein
MDRQQHDSRHFSKELAMSTRTPFSVRKSVLFALVTSASLLAISGGAHAEDSAPQTKVSYSDLDLNNSADAKRLYKRLRAAAERVCDHYEGRDLRRNMEEKNCAREALERAVQDVNHPAVLALHRQEGHVRVAQQSAGSQPRG